MAEIRPRRVLEPRLGSRKRGSGRRPVVRAFVARRGSRQGSDYRRWRIRRPRRAVAAAGDALGLRAGDDRRRTARSTIEYRRGADPVLQRGLAGADSLARAARVAQPIFGSSAPIKRRWKFSARKGPRLSAGVFRHSSAVTKGKPRCSKFCDFALAIGPRGISTPASMPAGEGEMFRSAFRLRTTCLPSLSPTSAK